jgi:hypothetical protein
VAVAFVWDAEADDVTGDTENPAVEVEELLIMPYDVLAVAEDDEGTVMETY